VFPASTRGEALLFYLSRVFFFLVPPTKKKEKTVEGGKFAGSANYEKEKEGFKKEKKKQTEDGK